MKNTFLISGITAAGEPHSLKVAAYQVNLVHSLADMLGFAKWEVRPWTKADEARATGRLQQIGGAVWHLNPVPGELLNVLA